MKTLKTTLLIFSLAIFVYSSDLSAQSTWSLIHTEFQTSCAGSSCHEASSSNPLKLVGTESAVYNNLINVSPINPAAKDSGYLLVVPFKADSSFLLRKISCGRGADLPLASNESEGKCMPDDAPLLDITFIELVRTWIAGGAPDTGVVSGLEDIVLDTEVNVSKSFSNTINVNYTLQHQAHVRLELINILGDKAVTFINELQAPGQYDWKFNTSTQKLSPGIYILNVFFDDHYITRKITQVE